MIMYSSKRALCVIDTFFGKKYVRKPRKDKAVSIVGQE
jgi:hypothetical protein